MWTLDGKTWGDHRPLPVREGERVELRGGEDALRDLHAKHLHVGLPLAVGAAHETEPPP